MVELTKKTLRECLSLIIDNRGKTPKKTDASGGYRILSANHVKSDGLVKTDTIGYGSESTYMQWMSIEIERGDIILTSEAPAGEVMLWDSDEKVIIAQRLFGLRVNPSVANNKFIKYYLQSHTGQKEIIRNTSGSTVFGISARMFDQINVHLPKNTLTQLQIGSLLHLLDNKIELNNRINAELEAMAKTLYDYWFLQFDFPDANGKPYKTSGGKMVYNPTLKREIPEGWKISELGEYISFKRGISYTSQDIQNTGVPLINLNSFTLAGKFKFQGTKYFNGKYRDENLLSAGDLVIAITDVTRNADIIGKAFVIPDVFQTKPLMSCDVASVSSTRFGKSYLEQLFNSTDYHEYIKHFASGTLVLHLDLNGVNWFNSFIPPIGLLAHYEAACEQLLKQRDIAIKENLLLEQLRDWLLPMLMNGQVTVNN
ncbi:MAG: restriction endonuclease subunit S [Methylophilus sp.]